MFIDIRTHLAYFWESGKEIDEGCFLDVSFDGGDFIVGHEQADARVRGCEKHTDAA
jgi:hypothetical protein